MPELPRVRTRRLDLRTLTPDYEEEIHALDNDPEVMEFINDGQPVSRESCAEMLARIHEDHSVDATLGIWVAHLLRQGDAFAGWFHLHPGSVFGDQVELGFRLRRDCWNKGLATEGSFALLDYGFKTLKLDRIAATTLAGNAASRRVMEKCGFSLEREFVYDAGLLPIWNNEDRRGVKYSLTRREYLRQ